MSMDIAMTALQADYATRPIYVTARLASGQPRRASTVEMKRAAAFAATPDKEFLTTTRRPDGTWMVQLRPGGQTDPVFRAHDLTCQQASHLLVELMAIQAEARITL
jgi:hypothetical protein